MQIVIGIFSGVIGAIILVILIQYLIAYFLHKKNFRRNNKTQQYQLLPEYKENKEYFDKLEKLEYEDLYIKSFDGLRLHAKLYKAKKETRKTIISVHGWQGDALFDSIVFDSFYLDDLNYNVCLVDLRAHGKSEGTNIGLASIDAKDLLLWIKKMNEVFDKPAIVLHGLSMGASTSMFVSDQVDMSVRAIVADCGFNNIYKTTKEFMTGNNHLPTHLILKFINHFCKRINKVDMKKEYAVDHLKNAKCPILFMHGDKDLSVSVKEMAEMYEACGNKNKEIHIFKDAPHARSYYLNKKEYKDITLAFLEKHLK